jgi:hypothetical protein
LLAERTGLEPATPGVTGRYSNQLNYRSSMSETIYIIYCGIISMALVMFGALILLLLILLLLIDCR